MEAAKFGDAGALEMYGKFYGIPVSIRATDYYSNGIVDEDHYIDTEYNIGPGDPDPKPSSQYVPGKTVPQYDLLFLSKRLDVFSETVTGELRDKIVIRQNIVYLGFNKRRNKGNIQSWLSKDNCNNRGRINSSLLET